MVNRMLIMCPHNAAKSVAAAALLRREAAARGREIEITTAGTHPDAGVVPLIADFLAREGLPAALTPRSVTGEDLAGADLVVNIGCERDELPLVEGGGAKIRDWAVPNFSDDADVAFADIRHRVSALADEIL